MCDYDWEYVIESVISKNPEKRSKYHDLIVGKRCIVPQNQEPPYCIGSIIVEPFGNHPSSRWFYTTLVSRFDKAEDGRIVMETQNSIYTFVPIQRGDNSDLLRQCSDNAD